MNQQLPRFNTIQALRFLAAASVVLYHDGYYLKVVGHRNEWFLTLCNDQLLSYSVYLFFAISGFVLVAALERSTVGGFLALRFLRIYPAFLCALMLSELPRWIYYKDYKWSGWRTWTLLPFGEQQYPLGVEWSLIYEIFFYLVLALLWLPASRKFLNWGLIIWTVLILFGYLRVGEAYTRLLPTITTIPFSLANLSFLAGTAAYRIYPRVIDQKKALVAASFIAIFLARLFLTSPLRYIALAVGSGALVTAAATQAFVKDLSPSSSLVRLGDFSYGVYLLHVSFILLFIQQPKISDLPTTSLTALAFFLALLIGIGFGWSESSIYKFTSRFVRLRAKR